MQKNNFGQSFVSAFSSANSTVPKPKELSTKTGLNKQKITALQQQTILSLQGNGNGSQ